MKSLTYTEKDSLYFNCYNRVMSFESPYFLSVFLGGRGVGKTYGTLKSALDNEVILLLRRTQTELDNCCNEASNPYKAINRDTGRNVSIKANKDNAVIVENVDDELIIRGYASALSTFGKFRGADYSDVTMIIFDEFINTSPVNNIKNEAFLFFNAIETINRNRELDGHPPVRVILLSNANTLDNDILRTLKLANTIKLMKEHSETVYKDDERGIYVELVENTGITDLKIQTALYKLTRGTAFYDMAIENEFTNDYFGDSKKLDYKEFYPIVGYENLYFYKHKNKRLLYVSERKANCTIYNKHDRKKFLRDYGYMLKDYVDSGLVIYSDYDVKLLCYELL